MHRQRHGRHQRHPARSDPPGAELAVFTAGATFAIQKWQTCPSSSATTCYQYHQKSCHSIAFTGQSYRYILACSKPNHRFKGSIFHSPVVLPLTEVINENNSITTTAVRATVQTKKSISSNTSSSVVIPSAESFSPSSPKMNYSTKASKDSSRTSQNLLYYEVTPPKPCGMTEAEKKVLYKTQCKQYLLIVPFLFCILV